MSTMSDYHVFETSRRRDRLRVAIHVDTPTGDNNAGVPWAQALLWSLGGSQESQVPWLETVHPTEAQRIRDGEVFETTEWVQLNANAGNAVKLQELEDYVARRMPDLVDSITQTLNFYGRDGGVPEPASR